MRRTKEQIELDNEFTCGNRKCKKPLEEAWKFTPYGNEARKQEASLNKSYCEQCFNAKEQEL